MPSADAPADPPPKPKRPSSAQRGYGHDWRVFRAKFLKDHPICCRIGCREPATDVDHEPELQGKDDPGRLDPARCAPLCKAHHAEKTMAQNREAVDEGKKKATAAKREAKEKEKAKSRAERTGSTYDSHRGSMAEKSRERSEAGRDIGELPPVVDAGRKNGCLDDFRMFCEMYFPHRFPLVFSESHLAAIAKLQACVLDGGLFAFAMPRGTGKTTLTECAALWAVLYGHRTYVVPISATQELGNQLVEAIKNEIDSNELLAEDFPEVCYPVAKLEGINQRTSGQTYGGERTRMDLSFGLLVLPTIAGTASSGACIEGKGLTGSIRGMKRSLAGGKQHRPDLVILDDPQSEETALSPTGNRKLERLINGAVLGLAGPRKKIAAVMPCTVIAPDDMVDRILDPDRNPQWNGERSKMLVSPPTNIELWDEYAERRRQSFREHGDGRDATEFYRLNRSAMDNGAKVSWAERYNPDDLSALQFAMNWKIDRPNSFAAECQNEPLREGTAFGVKEFDPSDAMKRLNGLERGVVPSDCSHVTAMVDVGGEILWWCVVAWNGHFGGSVIDYGTYPQQNRTMFAASDARPSLSTVYPGRSPSQRVFAALTALLPDLCGKKWPRQNGGDPLAMDRCLVDAGWGETVDAVYQACARFPLPVFPSKGYGRSTSSVGVAKWKPRPGERSGFHWRLSIGEGKRGRQVQFDPDAWKTFVHGAFGVPMGGPTGLTFFGLVGNDGRPKQAGQHELFAEHLNAEYSQPVTIRGDSFDKWSMRPDRNDNHWLDTLVGCAVAASVAGVKINATGSIETKTPAKPIRLRELQERNRAEKAKEPPKPDAAQQPAPPAKGKPISLRELQERNRKGR